MKILPEMTALVAGCILGLQLLNRSCNQGLIECRLRNAILLPRICSCTKGLYALQLSVNRQCYLRFNSYLSATTAYCTAFYFILSYFINRTAPLSSSVRALYKCHGLID